MINQDDPITQKVTKAAYNTVAGFAEGMESPEGTISMLNPFVGVATIGAIVPQLIQEVQAAEKTPPNSPERWQAGANVTAFLAAPAVLHAIAKGDPNLKTTNQGGIDASTSSTQSAPGIETPARRPRRTRNRTRSPKRTRNKQPGRQHTTRCQSRRKKPTQTRSGGSQSTKPTRTWRRSTS